MRGLRTLAPVRLTNARETSVNQRTRHAAFAIGMLAVILEFAVSGNSLENLGIPYKSIGGIPLVKLHPGTYLIIIATLMVLMLARPAGSGLIRLFRATPALACFVILTLFCGFYSIVNVGFSGAAPYFESYISAGLLAVTLEGGSDRQKRSLAWWIVGFCLISVVISIGEDATQTNLIPIHNGEGLPKDSTFDIEDFRPTGLFGHPLTAALGSSMALFLLLRMQMNGVLKTALFIAFLIGLLSFGDRTALGVTLAMLLLAATVALLRGIVTRDLSLGFGGTIGAAVFILLPLMVLVTTSTDVGERILAHLYVDDSAAVRNPQWLLLGHLNLPDVLFGVSPERLLNLKFRIGLGDDAVDIENFWLLMFLNLGIIGFVTFLIAFSLFLAHLGRITSHPLGWMLLISAIIIGAANTSLGRKSSDLVFMTACMIAMTGFRSMVPTATGSFRRKLSSPRPADQRLAAPEGLATERLGAERLGAERLGARKLRLRPTPSNLAGLKS